MSGKMIGCKEKDGSKVILCDDCQFDNPFDAKLKCDNFRHEYRGQRKITKRIPVYD